MNARQQTEEEAFASFGPEVPARAVPALVRSDVRVWSFGYGDEEGEFTTIDPEDLWAWDENDEGVIASWGPFRIDPVVVEAPKHTVRGKTSDEGWPYGTTHDIDCPACVASGSSYTASPRSETYWAS